MKTTLALCTAAVLCTLAYLGVSHRSQTAEIAAEFLKEADAIKGKLLSRLKPAQGPQIESTLSGDLKNIERKMQTLENTTKEEAKTEALSSSVQLRAVLQNQPVPSLLPNYIVDQIIEQYLKESLRHPAREEREEAPKRHPRRGKAQQARVRALTSGAHTCLLRPLGNRKAKSAALPEAPAAGLGGERARLVSLHEPNGEFSDAKSRQPGSEGPNSRNKRVQELLPALKPIATETEQQKELEKEEKRTEEPEAQKDAQPEEDIQQ